MTTEMLGLQSSPGLLRGRIDVQSPITTTRGILLASAWHAALAVIQRLTSIVLERVCTVAFTAVLHTSHAEPFLSAEVEALSNGEALAGHGTCIQSTVATVGGTAGGLPSCRDTGRCRYRWGRRRWSGGRVGRCSGGSGDGRDGNKNMGSLRSGCRTWG